MTQRIDKGVVELYESAVAHTRKYFAALKPAQHGDTTPCPDWDVKTLMAHMSGGFAFGINTSNAGSMTEADHDAAKAGIIPEAFGKGSTRMPAILQKPGLLDKTVKTPIGEIPGSQFLSNMLFMDMLIHGHDLAKGTGQDSTLPKDLVEASYAIASPRFASMPSGKNMPFGLTLDTPANASTQVKLLAGCGRKA